MAQEETLALAQQRQVWSMSASGSKPMSRLARTDLGSANPSMDINTSKPSQSSRTETGRGKVFINT